MVIAAFSVRVESTYKMRLKRCTRVSVVHSMDHEGITAPPTVVRWVLLTNPEDDAHADDNAARNINLKCLYDQQKSGNKDVHIAVES